MRFRPLFIWHLFCNLKILGTEVKCLDNKENAMSNSMGAVLESTATEVSGGGAKFATAASGVFISPWTADSNGSSHITPFPHGLGVVPQSILILFSPDQITTYPLQWSWNSDYSGNPVTVSMDATNVTLNIFAGAPLHGIWSPITGWTTFTNGYWKVIAKASA
jgi:hypothetical protein